MESIEDNATTYVEDRPWGRFEQFVLNKQCTVKIIDVLPQKQLSYQYHHNRDEFWKIISGAGFVVINDERREVAPGDELFLPRKTKHRIGAIGKPLKFMEISFGIFDEDDNIRLEDDYGRA